MTVNRRFYSTGALLLSEGVTLLLQDERSRVSLADVVEPNSHWENSSVCELPPSTKHSAARFPPFGERRGWHEICRQN